MTQNEFKQGDKVATTKCYDISIYGCSTTIPIGEEGKIEDIDGDELYVYFSGYSVYLTIPVSDVELIQPLDRKTAFLTELRELLRKYNVYLIAHKTDMPVSVYFNDSEDYMPFASIGKEGCKDCGVIIEPDNIMDFDKE